LVARIFDSRQVTSRKANITSAGGEEIIIGRWGKPLVRWIRLLLRKSRKESRRVFLAA
jgi:hypothetical protein